MNGSQNAVATVLDDPSEDVVPNVKVEKYTVLIVDDDGPILRALAARLEHAKYNVLASKDPSMALSLIDGDEPDIAILDINMPGIDGFKLAEKVKERVPACQILFLSANHAEEFKERAEMLGAIEFVEKPFDSQDLLRRLEEICG